VKKRQSFFRGAILGGLFLLFCFKTEHLSLASPKVMVFSQVVSGKTTDELESFLADKEKEFLGRKVVFSWQDNRHWEVIPQMIDFSLDKAKMAAAVVDAGKTEGGFSHLWDFGNFFRPEKVILPLFNFSQDKLVQITNQISKEVNQPAQDALFDFKEGKVISFQPSRAGWLFKGSEFERLVTDSFQSLSSDQADFAFDLPVVEVRPKVTTDQSNNLGIKELLAMGESFFNDSIPTRIYNIALAASRLHGIVIPPGETFSFAQNIGDISTATGYQQAYVIKNKQTILEDGGGVCQVSTTLFRAALNAGLPITERQAHYYRVGFYEQGGYPPGLDATVYPPSPDLKFKNDTGAYILIQTKIDKQKKRLAFEFYGTSDGRRVELEKPLIHSQTEPPPPIYVDEPGLPVGTEKRIDTTHWGAKVSFKRKIFTSTGELKEDRTFWSNYFAWPAVYQRGTGN